MLFSVGSKVTEGAHPNGTVGGEQSRLYVCTICPMLVFSIWLSCCLPDAHGGTLFWLPPNQRNLRVRLFIHKHTSIQLKPYLVKDSFSDYLHHKSQLTPTVSIIQVPCLPHMQKHLRRAGLLCYRGNTGYQVQVSLLREYKVCPNLICR